MGAERPEGGRVLRGIGIGLLWLLVLLGAVLFGIGLWVRATFGEISVDQLLSNLRGAGEGAGGAELVASGVIAGLVAPILAVLLLAFMVERTRRVLRRHGRFDGRRRTRLRWTAAVLACAVPIAGGAVLGATVGAGDYVRAVAREAATGVGLGDYYVAPEVTEPRAAGIGGIGAGGSRGDAGPRNLVLVYLESVENVFADPEVFGTDMLAPVERATAGWGSVPALEQYAGGGWTMSGIVATQCGIPLRTAGALGDPQELNALGAVDGERLGSYLPGARCLGDVLADEGYRNVFMGGADSRFAGKGAFLETHGTDEVRMLEEWKELGETEFRPDWGLSDRRLFARAAQEASELHAAGEPFSLTLLTLDTHESPHVYEYCDADDTADAAPMTSITRCSMQQVEGFIDHLEEEGILEDTTVVVMGDHLKLVAEGQSFTQELMAAEDRTIFNRFSVPGGAPPVARERIDQMSMYPTILELLGFGLRDHRAGIGVSALAAEHEVPAGTILDLAPDDYLAVVQSRSVDLYRELWAEPEA
ncbi:sulfatase-like hydrolase/transferase [Leucobacter allii]|uniref:sulfatase-like hydrolase/transferase n=1 Tax=Leucobacter allii TaxID=2932247 RepID=UPI001FD0DC1E|nr:sulfatase-like hydrolase/transferase [Leucobacter allii]UOR02226.1 sulfatase-like hydrolase/transferase [Leucobacter allii]